MSLLCRVTTWQIIAVLVSMAIQDTSSENGECSASTSRTEETSHIEQGDPELADQCAVKYAHADGLTRIDPGEVGHIESLQLEEGKVYQRVTRAKYPPIFEIPDFLNEDECDHIIQAAADAGLQVSGLFDHSQKDGQKKKKKKKGKEKEKDLKELDRISHQTYIPLDAEDPVFRTIRNRVLKLVDLPEQFLDDSEGIQVVRYGVGGHYHAHLDSGPEGSEDQPCCHQTMSCQPFRSDCCQLCRYMTVLVYLNNVVSGGETAFPVADKGEEGLQTLKSHRRNYNLSYNCHNSSIVVQPKRGMAVMWYNNLMDEETGWLGDIDHYSYHGGCDVLKGEKWIANVWISASHAHSTDKPSIYANRWG